MKKITFTLLFTLLIISIGSGQNLLTNGDFEAGNTGWGGNAANSVDDGSGTNKFNEANIATAGNPWAASLQYPGLVLEAGETYTLSYTAMTDAATATRTMAAGIGKNAPDWNSLTASPALTATATTFTHTFTVTYPNPENSRVVFDMGAQAGYVFIDDVSLTKVVAPAVDLPLDFETSPVNANLVGFDGGVMTVEAVVSPQSTGNTSTKLAKLVKGAGAVWAGAKIVLDTPFDFSTKSNIEVRIYTTGPIGSKIEFKAEGTGVPSGPKLAYTTKTGEWETLTFDFSGVTATNLTDLIMIPYMPDGAQGDGSEAATFYFDDIVQTEPPAATCTDGIQNQDETGIDCGGSSCATCPEITLPLDFSDASQLFTHNGAGAGGSVVLEAGKMRFNGNGQAYDQAYLDLTTSFSLMNADNNTFTVTMNPIGVADGEERTHLIRASFAGGSAAGTQITGKSVGSGSQDVTFNFGVSGAEAWSQIIIFMDYGPDGANTYNGKTTSYLISSITLGADPADTCSNGIKDGDETGIDCGGSCGPCSAPPTTAPTAPPARNAEDVISLYSEAYTNVASNFDAGWCGAAIKEVSIAGNNVQAFIGDNCQGIVLNAGIDASAFTNLHVDVYIEEGVDLTSKVFNLKFVQQPGAAAIEVNFNAASSPALVAGSWIAIDVVVDLSTLTGFKEFGITAGTLKNQVWYDNLYIHKGTALSVSDNELLNVSMYPNPTASKLNISAASTIKNVSIFNLIGRKVMGLNIDSNSAAIDVSGLSSGLYLINYTIGDAVGTAKFIKE